MSAIASYLPTVPKPPNDPMWWQLDGRAGWHIAELQYIEQQAAILGVRPASLRLVEIISLRIILSRTVLL